MSVSSSLVPSNRWRVRLDLSVAIAVAGMHLFWGYAFASVTWISAIWFAYAFIVVFIVVPPILLFKECWPNSARRIATHVRSSVSPNMKFVLMNLLILSILTLCLSLNTISVLVSTGLLGWLYLVVTAITAIILPVLGLLTVQRSAWTRAAAHALHLHSKRSGALWLATATVLFATLHIIQVLLVGHIELRDARLSAVLITTVIIVMTMLLFPHVLRSALRRTHISRHWSRIPRSFYLWVTFIVWVGITPVTAYMFAIIIGESNFIGPVIGIIGGAFMILGVLGWLYLLLRRRRPELATIIAARQPLSAVLSSWLALTLVGMLLFTALSVVFGIVGYSLIIDLWNISG